MIAFYKGATPVEKEYTVKTGINVPVGTALYLNNGVLDIAGGTTQPEFISVNKAITSAAEGTKAAVQVIDKSKTTEWIADASASISNIKVGNKVTLKADGTAITATTVSGIVEAIEIINNYKAVVKF